MKIPIICFMGNNFGRWGQSIPDGERKHPSNMRIYITSWHFLLRTGLEKTWLRNLKDVFQNKLGHLSPRFQHFVQINLEACSFKDKCLKWWRVDCLNSKHVLTLTQINCTNVDVVPRTSFCQVNECY